MTGRRVAAVALVAVVAALALLVRPFFSPSDDDPLDEGPVVVLGGSDRQRIGRAVEVLPDPTADRPLLLSHPASETFEELDIACDAAGVRCIRPEPASTWGEAVTIGELAADEEWSAVTVVTSDYHARRVRMLLQRCLDVPYRVTVSQESGRRIPAGSAVREALAAAISWFVYRDC